MNYGQTFFFLPLIRNHKCLANMLHDLKLHSSRLSYALDLLYSFGLIFSSSHHSDTLYPVNDIQGFVARDNHQK